MLVAVVVAISVRLFVDSDQFVFRPRPSRNRWRTAAFDNRREYLIADSPSSTDLDRGLTLPLRNSDFARPSVISRKRCHCRNRAAFFNFALGPASQEQFF